MASPPHGPILREMFGRFDQIRDFAKELGVLQYPPCSIQSNLTTVGKLTMFRKVKVTDRPNLTSADPQIQTHPA